MTTNKMDLLWETKWSKEEYPRIAPGVVHDGWGSTGEPGSSIIAGMYSEGFGKHFKEGVKVLDYGCGAARYCNFLSGHLKDFTYYGVEPMGGGPYSIYQDVESISETGIALAREAYGQDPRIHLGFIDSPVETEAIDNVDVVLLGSIFTHLDGKQFELIMTKLLPVVERGGCIVFSCFLAKKHKVNGPGAYGFKDTYQMSWLTKQQLTSFAKKTHTRLTECLPWEVTENLTAHIFRVEKLKNALVELK